MKLSRRAFLKCLGLTLLSGDLISRWIGEKASTVAQVRSAAMPWPESVIPLNARGRAFLKGLFRQEKKLRLYFPNGIQHAIPVEAHRGVWIHIVRFSTAEFLFVTENGQETGQYGVRRPRGWMDDGSLSVEEHFPLELDCREMARTITRCRIHV